MRPSIPNKVIFRSELNVNYRIIHFKKLGTGENVVGPGEVDSSE